MIVASLLRTAAACLAAATAGRRLWRSRGYGYVAPGPDDVSLDHGDSAYHGPRAEQLAAIAAELDASRSDEAEAAFADAALRLARARADESASSSRRRATRRLPDRFARRRSSRPARRPGPRRDVALRR